MQLFLKNIKRLANRRNFSSEKFKWLAIFLACSVVLVCFGAFHIYQLTQKTLDKERAAFANENEIFFEKISHEPHFNQFVQFIQNTKDVRFVEKFQNSYFAATGGGLLQFAPSGKLLKNFTVSDGLPESDLTSLAVFNSQLFIGTRENGLVIFNGEKFASFKFTNHETQAITTLFSDNQRLLIGTFAGGLIEFDGKKFREIKAADERIVGVNFIKADPSSIFIGTYAEGLWIFDGKIWRQFTNQNGLLSNRIVGVEIVGENLFVGTDLGVSLAKIADLTQNEKKIFHQSASLPTLSGLIKQNDQIFATKDNGEIYVFSKSVKRFSNQRLDQVNWRKPETLINSRLLVSDEKSWLVGTQGIWQISSEKPTQISLSKFGDFAEKTMPTSNVISALTIDRNSRLWAGNFRRGIDIFSGDGEKITHLETETLKEINFLDTKENSVIAATSKGAVSFSDNFKSTVLTKENGLPSNSITHISADDSSKDQKEIYATSRGVWIKEKEISRGFSTVNGLPSNTISATLFAKNKIFAGTLGGLAQIEKGKVTRIYKDSNSVLQNNWITALNSAGSRIFIGTYGGGIYELLPSGELRSFVSETGKIFVNPNAIFSDEKRLYVGSLDGAWILDFSSRKWSHLSRDLPSKVVLSVTGDAENVFFGTTAGIAKINKRYWLEMKKDNE